MPVGVGDVMVSYFVSYRGESAEPAAFIEHYAGKHAALLAELPGIRRLVVHTPIGWNDPFPVNHGDCLLLAQMTFDSLAALDTALASEARARARADFQRFPPFVGTVTHEAMLHKVCL